MTTTMIHLPPPPAFLVLLATVLAGAAGLLAHRVMPKPLTLSEFFSRHIAIGAIVGSLVWMGWLYGVVVATMSDLLPPPPTPVVLVAFALSVAGNWLNRRFLPEPSSLFVRYSRAIGIGGLAGSLTLMGWWCWAWAAGLAK